jgi:hypothetical protein
MTMPTKAKTWTHNVNNRIIYAAFLDTHQAILYAFKEMLKAVPGATVKGSGDNAAAAMDGTDRIGAAAEFVRGASNTTVHAWFVVTLANLGGIDLLVDFVGATDDQARITYSPGGLFVINATNARYSPTATDEVLIVGTATAGGAWGNATTNGDRIWSTAYATDGSALMLLVARAGVWVTHFIIEAVTSAVVAPATFAPAVVATGGTTAPAVTGWTSSPVWKCRANGGGGAATLSLYVSMEGTTGSLITQVYTTVLELQASQWPVMALGLWSTTVGARGKLCNLVDIYAGNAAAADGDTYPNDSSRQYVGFGDYVLVWNGTPGTPGAAPVMS